MIDPVQVIPGKVWQNQASWTSIFSPKSPSGCFHPHCSIASKRQAKDKPNWVDDLVHPPPSSVLLLQSYMTLASNDLLLRPSEDFSDRSHSGRICIWPGIPIVMHMLRWKEPVNILVFNISMIHLVKCQLSTEFSHVFFSINCSTWCGQSWMSLLSYAMIRVVGVVTHAYPYKKTHWSKAGYIILIYCVHKL